MPHESVLAASARGAELATEHPTTPRSPDRRILVVQGATISTGLGPGWAPHLTGQPGNRGDGGAVPPCPPNAGCARPSRDLERDGVAFDLDAGIWRPIADAPVPVPELAPTAVVGDRLYVHTGSDLLVWDSAGNSWSSVSPPRPLGWADLVADGARLVVVSGSDENGVRPDQVLDTTTGEWSTLPADPLKPAFDRAVTATPQGLVLTAQRIGDDGGPFDPSLVEAAVLGPEQTRWRMLPVGDQLGGWRWSWTGERLVDPTLGGSDGGETNNYGRVIPFGGRLDPAAGAWSPLPNGPEPFTGGWPVEAPGGPVMAAEGWLYDDRQESWTRLPRPQGGPETPGPAAWADGVLVVAGGTSWEDADGESAGDGWAPDDVYSTGAWAYVPG
jgi:hypothetical protein